MPKALDTFGGRDYAKLLNSSGVDFDGLTSTTNTTVSSESIKVPEGWVGMFIIDIDANTTATVTASVKVAFDGGTEWNQFYFDHKALSAAAVTIGAATDVSGRLLRFINPFPDIGVSGAIGDVLFRVDLETDGSDSSAEYGDCFYAVAPRVQGAVLEGVRA
jgi:hypothetical protein